MVLAEISPKMYRRDDYYEGVVDLILKIFHIDEKINRKSINRALLGSHIRDKISKIIISFLILLTVIEIRVRRYMQV